MATEKVLSSTNLSYDSGMDLFSTPASNLGVSDMKYLEYKPVNSYTSESSVRFFVPNAGSSYIFLPETRLKVKFRILKEDGTALPAMPAPPAEGAEQSLADKAKANWASVSLTNYFLHSLFDQIEISFGDTLVTKGDTGYPYKAMVTALLETTDSAKTSRLQSSLFYMDTPGYMDDLDINPSTAGNKGLVQRAAFIAESKPTEVIGPLHVDVLKVPKYLLNGVNIGINLFSTNSQFRLLSSNELKPVYKVDIMDISLIMCHVTPSNQLLLAHQKLMEDNIPARYFYVQEELRKFTIPKGQSSFFCENMFNSTCPDRMVLMLCDSAAVSGSYTANAFNFKHHNLSYLNATVNGSPSPKGPLKMDFKRSSYVSCFEDLFETLPRPQGPDNAFGNMITREAFEKGYSLFCIDFTPQTRRASFYPTKKDGSVRLELRFAEPLADTVILMCMTYSPTYFEIDYARNVFLGR